MISTYFNTAKRKKLQQIDKIRHGSWINVTNATKKDLEVLAEMTSLSLADIDDSLDSLETPRIEFHDGMIIIFVRQPVSRLPAHTDTLTILVSDQHFITISPNENETLNEFLLSDNPPATTQTTKFLLLTLLKITRSFTQQVKTVRNTVLSQERNNIESVTNEEIVQLIHNEEVLNQYLSALTPMKNVFEILLSGRHIQFHEDDSDLLEDLLISIRQSVDVCLVNLKSIQNLRDSYQIIFTNRLNSAVQRLTVLTIILTIPTILASLFGMNVDLPFMDSRFAFPGVLLLSVVLSSIVYFGVKRKKWL